MSRTLELIVFLITLHFVSAQFNFFGNVFGGHQQQQQQRPSSSQWSAYSESVPCSQYLCPGTLECVAKPVDCPCPSPEDIKCIIPDLESSRGDGTVVCTRGNDECTEVARLMKKGTHGKKSK